MIPTETIIAAVEAETTTALAYATPSAENVIKQTALKRKLVGCRFHALLGKQ